MKKLRFRSQTFWLASVLAMVSPANAAIFNKDDRISIAQVSDSDYAPIGRVIGDSLAGTGFLVSECHVLTVQHAFSKDRPAVGQRMTFIAGRGRSVDTAQSSGGLIVASGILNLASQAESGAEGRSRDWILIQLDLCLGKSLGFVEISVDEKFNFDIVSAPVRSAGFPADRPSAEILILDPECRIHGSSSREMLHDCAALPGNSGSPIFREVSTAGGVKLRVIAMVTCGEHDSRPSAYNAIRPNRATKMAYILPAIKRFITPLPRP